jgi:hypothetical protein
MPSLQSQLLLDQQGGWGWYVRSEDILADRSLWSFNGHFHVCWWRLRCSWIIGELFFNYVASACTSVFWMLTCPTQRAVCSRGLQPVPQPWARRSSTELQCLPVTVGTQVLPWSSTVSMDVHTLPRSTEDVPALSLVGDLEICVVSNAWFLVPVAAGDSCGSHNRRDVLTELIINLLRPLLFRGNEKVRTVNKWHKQRVLCLYACKVNCYTSLCNGEGTIWPSHAIRMHTISAWKGYLNLYLFVIFIWKPVFGDHLADKMLIPPCTVGCSFFVGKNFTHDL